MTAELAVALPAVTLVIAITLAGFGLQIERMKLVAAVASAARALGRGESVAQVEADFSILAPNSSLNIEHLENHVCASARRSFSVAQLENFEIVERQCARKMGL